MSPFCPQTLARTAAGADPVEIRWSELATRIVGRDVTISLERGATVRGQALAVRVQSLLLKVSKSSDQRRYAQGETILPHTAITELRDLEQRGKGLRVGGAVGAYFAGRRAERYWIRLRIAPSPREPGAPVERQVRSGLESGGDPCWRSLTRNVPSKPDFR